MRPKFRGKASAGAMLRRLAERCVEKGYGARSSGRYSTGMTPSIAFYRSLGAEIMDDWRICRLSGQALQTFANEGARR